MLNIVGIHQLTENDLFNVMEFISVTKNNSTFTIKLMTADSNNIGDADKGEPRKFTESCSIDFIPEDYFIPRSGVELFVIDGTIKVLTIQQQYATRDGKLLSGTPHHFKRLAAIWFYDQPDQCVLMLYKQAMSDPSLTYKEYRQGILAGQVLIEFYPEMQKFVKARTYRRQILEEFDAHTVLAYLEAQIDLLSVIVQRITEGHPELITELTKELPLQEIFTAINDTNVTQVKDIEACLGEITTHKKRMRELQKLYLDAKNGVAND